MWGQGLSAHVRIHIQTGKADFSLSTFKPYYWVVIGVNHSSPLSQLVLIYTAKLNSTPYSP